MKPRSVFASQLLLVFMIFSVLIPVRAGTPTKLVYELKTKQKWSKDFDHEPLEAGDEHFNLVADKTVDLQISVGDENLLAELKNQGLKTTIEQIQRAKDRINSLVSDVPVIIHNEKVEDIPEGKKLSFDCEFSYGPLKYHSTEVYYLYEKKTFQARFRWNEKSDLKQIQLAQTDFKTLTVRFK